MANDATAMACDLDQRPTERGIGDTPAAAQALAGEEARDAPPTTAPRTRRRGTRAGTGALADAAEILALKAAKALPTSDEKRA